MRRNSASSLLKNPNDQVISKVQRQLEDMANCTIKENSQVTTSKTGDSRTVRTQNGTIVNRCDQGAAVDHPVQQKDTNVPCINTTIKGNKAT